MKPKLKIGFTDTHDHIATFFFNVINTRYDLELDNENPNVLIFGDENFGTNNLNFSRNNCTKIFYTGENRRASGYDCDYAISFDYTLNTWHYRLPLFVVYMWALEHIHKGPYPYGHLLNRAVKPKEKEGFCSFVVSNPACKERIDFFERMNRIKRVDSAGKLMNNTGVNLAGELEKIDYLSTRKFNICFESQSHPGYVTEKLLHAFYAKTVPIYWGSPTVELDFNRFAMINVHSFKNFDEAIDFVMKVDADDDLYNSMVNQPAFPYNIPPSYLLMENFLNWFDAAINKKIEPKAEETYLRV